MDYTEQQRFLRGSRLWGGVLVCVFFGVAIAIHKLDGRETAGLLAIIALIIAALGVLIYYAPDYLHLTVNPQKGPAWAIRIRWRIIGAVLVLGLLGARSG